MKRLRVKIPGQPVGKGRPRAAVVAGHARMFTPKQTREWEATAAMLMRERWVHEPAEAPCAVTVTAVARRPQRMQAKRHPDGRTLRTSKPDGDNVLKAVLDALTAAGVVADDRYISMAQVASVYAARGEEPHVEVWLDTPITLEESR